MNKKDVPPGVKLISVLYYIGVLLSLFNIVILIDDMTRTAPGFTPLLFPIILINIVGSIFNVTMIPSILGIIAIDLAGVDTNISRLIILLLSAVFNFFIGMGLWKEQKWSRIVVRIFSPFGAIASLFAITRGFNLFGLTGLLGLVISLSIGIYLLFNNRVKDAFS